MTLTAKEIYHLMRQCGAAPKPRVPAHLRGVSVHHAINERAEYGAILARCVENGKIGVLRSGMDCDCNKYSSARIVDAPVGAIQFARQEEEHYNGLDGPESTVWRKPSQTTVGYTSRDLAAEAHEDGHRHVVYA